MTKISQNLAINQEVFKEIPNHQGYYISNHSNVLSKKKKIPRFLIPRTNENDKPFVRLRSNGKRVYFFLEDLVSSLFMRTPQKGEVLIHIDGNKGNNNLCNLKWVKEISLVELVSDDEIFKPIPNFEGLYSISNYGRLLSHKTKFKNTLIWKNNINDRYASVRLRNPENKTDVQMWVHRLVASAFIKNPLKKPCVNHIDGNKLNNFYLNLEWVTYKENTDHSIKNGLTPLGEHVYNSKLNSLDVLSIRKIHKNGGVSMAKLAIKYNVSTGCVQRIIERKSWKHI